LSTLWVSQYRDIWGRWRVSPIAGREGGPAVCASTLVPMRFRRRSPRWSSIAPLMARGTQTSQEAYESWIEANTWDPSRGTELTIESDLSPAAWLEPRLAARTFEVRMSAPQGFEAYCRIFFPFVMSSRGAGGDPVLEYVTWRERARRAGRTPHALMEHETIDVESDGKMGHRQTQHSFGPEQSVVLLEVLTRHTSSAGGWFLLWEGYGDLNRQAFRDDGPKVRHPMRNYFLLKGPLRAFDAFPCAPDYWWPDDRAWCVCTDTDFEWAYLAASAACIDEALSRPIIDALRTQPENPARYGMDVMNPRPIDEPRLP
jgi:hypothetical protein